MVHDRFGFSYYAIGRVLAWTGPNLNPSMLSWRRLPAFNLLRPFLPPSQRFKHPVVFMILAVGFSWVGILSFYSQLEPLLVDCNLPTRQFLSPNQALNQTASCYISKPSAKHQIAIFYLPNHIAKLYYLYTWYQIWVQFRSYQNLGLTKIFRSYQIYLGLTRHIFRSYQIWVQFLPYQYLSLTKTFTEMVMSIFLNPCQSFFSSSAITTLKIETSPFPKV